MRLDIPVKVRWADLDAYGHVNNTDLFRLLEEARIAAFWATDDPGAPATAILHGKPGSDTLTFVAHQEIEYVAPIPYVSSPLNVQLWLGKLGGASMQVCYEVSGWLDRAAKPTLFAKATTTIVLVDSETGRPRRIGADERVAWEPYVEQPVTFARR